jgi:hypothetical protein
MELPGRKKYSFPVIVGMNSGEPPSTRSARMKIYNDVVSQLDAGGARYSQELSEIDLSDPDDVKVTANNHAGEVLVHLGSSHYLERYKIYVTHVQEWQQQFDKLESVDLRYDRQIIVNPDLQGPMKQPPLSAEAARKAMAAGVKPAALITRISTLPRPSPALTAKPVATSAAKPAPSRPAASAKTANTAHRKARVRPARTSSKGRTKAKHTTAAKTPSAKTKPAPKSVAAAKASAKPSPAIAEKHNRSEPARAPSNAIDVAATCALVAEITDNGLRYRGHGVAESRGSRGRHVIDKAVNSPAAVDRPKMGDAHRARFAGMAGAQPAQQPRRLAYARAREIGRDELRAPWTRPAIPLPDDREIRTCCRKSSSRDQTGE